MPLQHTYMPTSITQMYGNKSTLEAIAVLMERKEDVPHSFLFHGPSGTGKTTLAYIVAEMLQCKDPMLIDASDDRGINSMRALKELSQYAPRVGKTNVFILDEAAGLLVPAQEALLKLLENPPSHSYFILCTTDPQKLKITLKRRCHEFELKLLNSDELGQLLEDVLDKENVNDFKKEFVKQIISISNGSAGIALKLLDEVIDCEDDVVEDILSTQYAEESTVIDICKAMMEGNWDRVKDVYKRYSGEPEALRRAILGYFEKVLLGSKNANAAAMIMANFIEPFDCKQAMTLALFMSCYKEE